MVFSKDLWIATTFMHNVFSVFLVNYGNNWKCILKFVYCHTWKYSSQGGHSFSARMTSTSTGKDHVAELWWNCIFKSIFNRNPWSVCFTRKQGDSSAGGQCQHPGNTHQNQLGLWLFMPTIQFHLLSQHGTLKQLNIWSRILFLLGFICWW